MDLPRSPAKIAMNNSGFTLGRWRVQPRLLRLDGGDQSRTLRPKVLDLLLALAERPGRVVTKEEILESVWEGSIVGDEVLRRTVFELRKVLDDDPKSPRFVETIPRVGYRLIAPITRDVPDEDRSAPEPVADGQVTNGQVAKGQVAKGQDENAGTTPGEAHSRDGAGDEHRRSLRAFAAAAVLLAAAGALVMLRGSVGTTPSPPPAVTRQALEAPEETRLELRPLTSLPGQETQPELSRDGRRLAFLAIDPKGVSDLYLLELDTGSAPIRLTDDPDLQGAPAFDPTGRRLAYFHDGREGPELRLRDLETDDARRLTTLPSSDLEDLGWSPDGRWLAVAVRPRSGAPVRIHLYSFATGELAPLTEPPAGYEGDVFLSWSPDSETLAFVRARDRADSDLFTVDLAGEPSVRRITRLSTLVHGSGWNRSGDALYFLRYQPGRKSLWRVPSAGGPPRAVAELGERSIEMAVNAEGRRLVFSEDTARANIWRLALDEEAAEPEPLIESTAIDGSPALSPDGRQLAFLSNRSGYFEIWIADADGANPRQRTWFEGPLLRYPSWSPDGERLVVGVYSDASSDIFLVPVAGPPEPMTTDPARDILPTFSADGEAVYFASDRGGDWQIWRMAATGGTPEPVTEGYRALDTGPGGLLFTRLRQPQLFRLDADGSASVIAELGGRGGRDRWALFGGTVYYFRPEGPDLVRRRLGSDRVESLASVKHSLVDPGVCVSPDGRYLLWTAVEDFGRDLKLLENFTGL